MRAAPSRCRRVARFCTSRRPQARSQPPPAPRARFCPRIGPGRAGPPLTAPVRRQLFFSDARPGTAFSLQKTLDLSSADSTTRTAREMLPISRRRGDRLSLRARGGAPRAASRAAHRALPASSAPVDRARHGRPYPGRGPPGRGSTAGSGAGKICTRRENMPPVHRGPRGRSKQDPTLAMRGGVKERVCAAAQRRRPPCAGDHAREGAARAEACNGSPSSGHR